MKYTKCLSNKILAGRYCWKNNIQGLTGKKNVQKNRDETSPTTQQNILQNHHDDIITISSTLISV